jgi:UDP-2,4-diacetamido-2,4,6-trideoxy-beta-L-altropyranose hydrolase
MGDVVLLSAPASGTIGLGHVARLSALGAGLRENGARTVFVTASQEPRVHAFILAGGAELCVKPDLRPQTVLDLASEVGAERIAIDSYEVQADDVRALREAGRSVLYVDDTGLAPSGQASWVLNQNFFAKDVHYTLQPGAQLLLGPAYALLRSEFARARDLPQPARSGPPRVLVTLGGADPLGLLPRFIQALAALGEPVIADIVVGAADPKSHVAREAAKTLPLATVTVGASDMADRIVRADAVISAAGSTCLEIACIGRPAIVVAVADNQVPVADFLERGGLMSAVSTRGSVPELVRAIRSLLGGLSSEESCARISSQRCLVDGGGASRVAASWLGLGRSR